MKTYIAVGLIAGTILVVNGLSYIANDPLTGCLMAASGAVVATSFIVRARRTGKRAQL